MFRADIGFHIGIVSWALVQALEACPGLLGGVCFSARFVLKGTWRELGHKASKQ